MPVRIHPFGTLALLLVLGLMLEAPPVRSQCANPANTIAATPGGALMVCPLGDGPALGIVGSPINVNSSAVPCTGMAPIDFELDGAIPAQICDCLVGGVPFVETAPGSGIYNYAGPVAAGGLSLAGMQMKVQGFFVPLVLPLQVNSPDMNADGIVNLADLGLFAGLFTNAVYDFAVDYNLDGVENLADVATFAVHFGHGCACDPVD
jgi:hypothetical protein